MFTRVLIANRGEIACRVAKSVQAAGGQAVAIYSDADRSAPHVSLCDLAVALGGSTATDSYLDVEKVLAAATTVQADAIHPGYGFLSENADFARACQAAGLTFIGPSPEAIEVMGNKRAAKVLVSQADVPCIPGYEGQDQSDATLIKEAVLVGFPIMVKAAAGGGGRGMRVAASAADLPDALESARTEAKNAFGSDELILERVITSGRHIEIQVAADSHGNVIHLCERDCSLQRRHQKVIEEAPSPFVSESLRNAMGQAAVNAARSCGYLGVGTVEFLVADDESFSFLEMNTRLQVEHPVTEIVTGTDLVDWQLKIAAGQPLPLTQDEVTLSGHAIEARLYAENPAADFMPQTGSILSWRPPQGTGIRVDDGIAAPGEISPYYDSMVAKIIASGDTREEARRRLLQALKSTSLLGVGTNRAFLAQLLEDDTFVTGNATTSYIDDRVLDKARQLARPSATDVALGLVALVRAFDPQPNHLANWSNVAAIKRFKMLAVNDVELAVAYRARGTQYEVEIAGETVALVVESTSTDSGQPTGNLICQIDGVRFEVPIAFDGERVFLSRDRAELAIEDLSYRPVLSESAASSGQIMASTEGQVVLVAVSEGDRVTAGQLLVVVEAMKMEHRHTADGDGIVTAVQVSQATQVKKNQLLVSLELDESSAEESAKS